MQLNEIYAFAHNLLRTKIVYDKIIALRLLLKNARAFAMLLTQMHTTVFAFTFTICHSQFTVHSSHSHQHYHHHSHHFTKKKKCFNVCHSVPISCLSSTSSRTSNVPFFLVHFYYVGAFVVFFFSRQFNSIYFCVLKSRQPQYKSFSFITEMATADTQLLFKHKTCAHSSIFALPAKLPLSFR